MYTVDLWIIGKFVVVFLFPVIPLIIPTLPFHSLFSLFYPTPSSPYCRMPMDAAVEYNEGVQTSPSWSLGENAGSQGRPVSIKHGARYAMGKVGETKNPKRGNFNVLL